MMVLKVPSLELNFYHFQLNELNQRRVKIPRYHGRIEVQFCLDPLESIAQRNRQHPCLHRWVKVSD